MLEAVKFAEVNPPIVNPEWRGKPERKMVAEIAE